MPEQHKICLVGAAGVGKTSLVSRFVWTLFSDGYQTTIGVAIHRKRVICGHRELDLIIWDLSGEDEFEKLHTSYLRGASGLLFVIDGTRKATVETAIRLRAEAQHLLGNVPSVCVVNKTDLESAWGFDEASEARLSCGGCAICRTSAKTGAGVDDAFLALAHRMLLEQEPTAKGAE